MKTALASAPADVTLKAEELLDLPPDDEREVGSQHEQRDEDGPEAEPSQASLPHALLPGAPTGSMEPVRAIDR